MLSQLSYHFCCCKFTEKCREVFQKLSVKEKRLTSERCNKFIETKCASEVLFERVSYLDITSNRTYRFRNVTLETSGSAFLKLRVFNRIVKTFNIC